MNPKMPVLSGEHLMQALAKFGYQAVRQKGSHIRLRHPTDTQRQAVTVPLHKETAFGTLRRILRDARISVDELLSVL